MAILKVRNLTKRYESFTLDGVSFDLDEGYIMGFIGRNGAGKTTTLKSMLGLVHPDSGEVEICGLDFKSKELQCKREIGFVLGGFDFYLKRRLSAISAVERRFYPEWDEAGYREYLRRFELDENKKVEELSEGMKVKFSLALALSRRARLLILDEPTSGLDPVSRDELLQIFRKVIEDGGHSVLFSTHITSDLEKCADFITYIKDGKIVKSCEREDFIDSYIAVSGRAEQLDEGLKQNLIGYKQNAFGFTGLALAEKRELLSSLQTARPDIETIMIYSEEPSDSEVRI
ncbi:MAG: ABC transporter ATP-binding protein [Oscillospiraceae bacterium]|nr:ABC transporter ATP-binding protein [Oscillospiraceae bacterium]